jgi:hypothetical protein
MKPSAVLEMYMKLYDQQVISPPFVADADSSIKAKLKRSNADCMANNNTTEQPTIVNSKGNVVKRPDHGGIPVHMPEPTFVADPNHRRKTLANCLCALALLSKRDPMFDHKKKNPPKRKNKYDWNLTMTKMDVRRLAKSFTFMARTL